VKMGAFAPIFCLGEAGEVGEAISGKIFVYM
jgi:hypothetical protein